MMPANSNRCIAPIDMPVARCYGDGAYDRWHVHRLLAYSPMGQSVSIEAIIPPRDDAQIKKSKRRYRPIEARNQRATRMRKVGRKKWKQQSGYHRRSLVETAMARFKRIIGPQTPSPRMELTKSRSSNRRCYTQSNDPPRHAPIL